jgi:hypothetical protein
MRAVQDRMGAKAREAELSLELEQHKEEALHQKRRVEMLHVEYQRRIQSMLPPTDGDEAAAPSGASSPKAASTRGLPVPTPKPKKHSAAASPSKQWSPPATGTRFAQHLSPPK